MEDNKKNHEVYTKEMLVKKVAKQTRTAPSTARLIVNTLEDDIFELLATVNQDTDVSIRLFEGISIDGKYVPEKTKVNNLTGKPIVASSKIKAKANVTRNYCEKLTNYNK